MRGLTLNRIPGYHFAGNFFGTAFGQVAAGGTRVHLAPGPHSIAEDGSISLAGIALLADIAMGTTIRARSDPAMRLATTRIHLEFSGIAPRNPVVASSQYRGTFEDGIGHQGLSEVSIRQGDDLICYGSGAFIAVDVPPGSPPLAPFPWRHPEAPPPALLDRQDLDEQERWILAHAESILDRPGTQDAGFIHRFLGFEPQRTHHGASVELQNGPHIGNRVGHMQGGLQLALAAVTAGATLGQNWKLSSITACFIKPGQGERFKADAHVIHAGRLTAVIRTQITSAGKLMLEALSTHSQTGTA